MNKIGLPGALLWALLSLASCAFEVQGVELSVGPDPMPEPMSDMSQADDAATVPPDLAPPGPDLTPGPVAAFCEDDSALVACYRFEDGAHPTEIHDGSKYANQGTAAKVTFGPGV